LLSKVQQIAGPGIDKISQKADLYQLFLKLLNQHNPMRNKVSYYAGILNTTPQNLNAACRKAIDLPAAEVLAGFIVNEAKRLLLYTDKTVSEISFSLNFNDPSHFVKYFKRLSGHTPQSFREAK
jgi:AraC-like DNA-binding protein